MRLYAPAILLAMWAVLLAVVGDGTIFGVLALVSLAGSVVVQVEEGRRVHRRRRNGR